MRTAKPRWSPSWSRSAASRSVASARPSGAWSPARLRFLCNSGGPARPSEDRATMKLLFVADPLTSFKIYKDTTFAMMREAAKRGHELFACQPEDLTWQRGGKVTAPMLGFTLTGSDSKEKGAWFAANGEPRETALAEVDAVVMRK